MFAFVGQRMLQAIQMTSGFVYGSASCCLLVAYDRLMVPRGTLPSCVVTNGEMPAPELRLGCTLGWIGRFITASQQRGRLGAYTLPSVAAA